MMPTPVALVTRHRSKRAETGGLVRERPEVAEDPRSGVALHDAVAEDAVDEPLARLVGFEVHARFGRGAVRVAEGAALDEEVLGGDDAQALAAVVVAHAVADQNVAAVGLLGIGVADVDAVAATVAKGEAEDLHIRATAEGQGHAPLALGVLGLAHPEGRAVAAECDVALAVGAEEAVARARERALARRDDDTLFEHDLLVALEGDGFDDPVGSNVRDDDPASPGADGALKGRGRVDRVEPPPCGVGNVPHARLDLADGYRVGRRGRPNRHEHQQRCHAVDHAKHLLEE